MGEGAATERREVVRVPARFYFSDIVVVDGDQIGCIVKTWEGGRGYTYEVYVRSQNGIIEFSETEVQRYIVSKELSEEEQSWHR